MSRLAMVLIASALTNWCARIETAPPHGGEAEQALVTAVMARDAAGVDRLLQAGADPNRMVAYQGHDHSAWELALREFRPRHPEQAAIIAACLKGGANPDAAWGTSGDGTGPRAPRVGPSPPLQLAMLHPDAQVVRAIVAVKPRASGGETALVMAIEAGESEIAHLLVEAGVDVNCYPGNTPLLAAIEARDAAMMTYLEQHGAREKP